MGFPDADGLITVHDEVILGALSRPECRRLLAAANVGRLLHTDDVQPEIWSVPYFIHDEHELVLVITGDVRRAVSPAIGSMVGFQVDTMATDPRHGWTVLVMGVLSAWQPEPDDHLTISGELVTGCQLVRADSVGDSPA